MLLIWIYIEKSSGEKMSMRETRRTPIKGIHETSFHVIPVYDRFRDKYPDLIIKRMSYGTERIDGVDIYELQIHGIDGTAHILRTVGTQAVSCSHITCDVLGKVKSDTLEIL